MKGALSTALLVVLLGSLAGGCGSAGQYSDDALRAAKALLRTNSDDAARGYLDDLARAGGSVVAAENAALTWSRRIDAMTRDVLNWMLIPPDETGRVKAFVVGSACEALKRAADGVLTDDEIRVAISSARMTSPLPNVISLPGMMDDLAVGIRQAVESGQTYQLSRSLACLAAS